MINSYKALSSRYLKSNKKRTILTIIGIILSVALITSICTFILTVQNSMIENEKKNTGAFHVGLVGISESDLSKVEVNPRVESVGVFKGAEPVPFINNKSIQLNYLNEASFDLMNVTLEEGQIPKKENEIVIERWILKYFEDGVKVGDSVKISDTSGNLETYILVGIVKDNWSSQSEGVARAYISEDVTSLEGEGITALVEIKENADKWQVINEMKEAIDSGVEISPNEELLRLTGESIDSVINESIFMVVFIVISIVVLATVVVIYNAFQISIAERMKQFGLLRAIGTTKKQIINLVLREATLMILIGIPLGIFFGIIAVYCIAFVFSKLSSVGEFSNLKVIISPIAILLSGGVGAASIYVSAYLPARAAGKTSPLVAISSQALIKKEKRSMAGLLLGRFLKIDMAMALKNVKRNRKRFYITVFSMAISVTLFVTFTSFAKFSTNFADEITEVDNKDFYVSIDYSYEDVREIDNDIIELVRNIPNVDKVYLNRNYIQSKSISDKKDIPKEVIEWDEYNRQNNGSEGFSRIYLEGEEKILINTFITTYEDSMLSEAKKYIKEGSIDNLKDDEVIIVRNTRFLGERTLISPIINLKVGDEIILDMNYYNEEKFENWGDVQNYKNDDVKKVKVAAIVDVEPFSGDENYESLSIIASEKTAQSLIEGNKHLEDQYGVNNLDIRLTDDKYADEVDEALRNLENTTPGIMYYNRIQSAKEEKAQKLQMMILLMGFTIVVSLISAVNIINTVTTNILLRKKELSALKAIGMTKKQMRRMITFEGVLFGIYGGVIGSILGTGLSYMLYDPMNSLRHFAFSLPWESIIIAMVAVVVMGYVSALIPLRRLKKENIIEGIRGE